MTCLKSNSSIKFKVNFFPLAIVFFLWLSNFNQVSKAQQLPSTPTSPPSTTAPVTSKSSSTSTSNSESTTIQLTEEVKKQIASEVKEVKEQIINNYAKDIFNTVYLSLLSTVVTIAIFGAGINWYLNSVLRKSEKEDIKNELKNDVMRELKKIVTNHYQKMQQENAEILDELSKKMDALKIRVKLLEFEIARISAKQMASAIHSNSQEKNKLIYECPQAIEEYIRSFDIIQTIKEQEPSLSTENITGIFTYSLDAANDIVNYLQEEKIKPFFTIEQIERIIKMLDHIDVNDKNMAVKNIRAFLENFQQEALSNR